MNTLDVFAVNQDINAKLLDITHNTMPDSERRAIASDIRDRVNRLCTSIIELNYELEKYKGKSKPIDVMPVGEVSENPYFA